MCPLAGWASSGCGAASGMRAGAAGQAKYHAKNHAMNMRAAEAIVSKAPKAMKIFPISEV